MLFGLPRRIFEAAVRQEALSGGVEIQKTKIETDFEAIEREFSWLLK